MAERTNMPHFDASFTMTADLRDANATRLAG